MKDLDNMKKMFIDKACMQLSVAFRKKMLRRFIFRNFLSISKKCYIVRDTNIKNYVVVDMYPCLKELCILTYYYLIYSNIPNASMVLELIELTNNDIVSVISKIIYLSINSLVIDLDNDDIGEILVLRKKDTEEVIKVNKFRGMINISEEDSSIYSYIEELENNDISNSFKTKYSLNTMYNFIIERYNNSMVDLRKFSTTDKMIDECIEILMSEINELYNINNDLYIPIDNNTLTKMYFEIIILRIILSNFNTAFIVDVNYRSHVDIDDLINDVGFSALVQGFRDINICHLVPIPIFSNMMNIHISTKTTDNTNQVILYNIKISIMNEFYTDIIVKNFKIDISMSDLYSGNIERISKYDSIVNIRNEILRLLDKYCFNSQIIVRDYKYIICRKNEYTNLNFSESSDILDEAFEIDLYRDRYRECLYEHFCSYYNDEESRKCVQEYLDDKEDK